MKQPELVSAARLAVYKQLLEKWSSLLRDLRETLLELGSRFSLPQDENDPKRVAVAEISVAQFFTFSSIAILINQAHFADAYTLLRVLYEGHLHLWNICNGDQEQAERYVHLAAIQDWRIAHEAVSIQDTNLREDYFTDAKMLELRTEYERAVAYFRARSGKIPRNYTTISNEKLAQLIDLAENRSRPFRQLMHVRLFSAGSEYVHRSLFGIREGFAAVEHDVDNHKWTFAPNPVRGIEAAWWSSLIVIDGVKWQASFLDIQFPDRLRQLREQSNQLAVDWLTPKD